MSRLLKLILIFAFFSCKKSSDHVGSYSAQDYEETNYITTKNLEGSSWIFDTPLKEDAYTIRFTRTEYIVETEYKGTKSSTRERYYLSPQKPSFYDAPKFDSTKIGKVTMGEYLYIGNSRFCIVKHIYSISPTKLQLIYCGDTTTYVRVD